MIKCIKFSYLIMVIAILSACGGSGDDAPSQTPVSDTLSGDVTISASSPIEVAIMGSTSPLPSAGSGSASSGAGFAASASIAGLDAGHIISVSGTENITGPTGSGASSIDVSDLTSTVTISLSYSGSETLDYCSVNSPFQSLDCLVGTGTTVTRQELSDSIGTGTTASFSIEVNKNNYNPKSSNSINAEKHTITQISNINVGADDVDGSSNDTQPATAVFNSELYFTGYDASGYTKLYRYDGSTITKISNINPTGDDFAYITTHLVVFNSELYFNATEDGTNYKLYKYNGTNITKISNINAVGNDNPAYLTVFNGALYFSATSDGTNYKLHKYDGTNITQKSEVNIGGTDNIANLIVFNNDLYFSSSPTNNGADYKLYKYDGVNIIQVSNIAGVSGGFIILNGNMYFPSGAGNFYKYDGVTIKQIVSNEAIFSTYLYVVYNNALYFRSSYNGTQNFSKFDGTSVTIIGAIEHPRYPVISNGELFFENYGESGAPGRTLYKYDGTNITRASSMTGIGMVDKCITEFNGALYFVAEDGSGFFKFYKYE
ncbi:MAG: hypothetical protein WCQ53_05655 [bacterium]